MAMKRLIIEFGQGVDMHGGDQNNAVLKATKERLTSMRRIRKKSTLLWLRIILAGGMSRRKCTMAAQILRELPLTASLRQRSPSPSWHSQFMLMCKQNFTEIIWLTVNG